MIYKLSKDKEVSQDAGKMAVRLNSDTTWLHYAKQGFRQHDVPEIRAKMAATLNLSSAA